MAISNNSTGLRTGVCTSASRPTAPYEGQMIYETDTDLTYIWGGSAWQQVSGGTPIGNSGLVCLAGGSFSGVPTFDVTGFSTDYVFYDLKMSVGGTSAMTAQLVLGSAVRNTNYYGSTLYTQWNGPYGILDLRGNGSNFLVTDLNTAPPSSVSCFITGVGQNSFNINISGVENLNTRTITGGYSNYAGGGTVNTFDKIRFTSAANMVGSWTLMGVRKP